MTRSANTGATVPGWIRDEIRRLEQAWPCWVLAGAAGAIALLELILGVALWRAEADLYYLRP